MEEALFDVTIQGSRNSIAALDVAQLLYLLVEIRAPLEQELTNLPINLCLVIDRSTSMSGDRIERVKGAAALIIEKLGPNDVLSVVAFSDRADVVVTAGPVENKAPIISEIRRILASGGTEIYQGLQSGFSELRKVALEGRANHLILLTDGHTYGDADLCLQLAREAASQGVGLSAFGIGSEWNDEFLDRLVAPSGGQSAYVETPAQVVEFLQQRIQGLGSVYAQNLRLVTRFPMGVELRYGYKVTPFAQPLTPDDQYRLGTVEGRTPLSILLEFSIEPQLPDRTLALPVSFVGDIPAMKVVDHLVKEEFALAVVGQDAPLSPPKEVVDAVQALNFYRMNEQVWRDVEAGQLKGATDRLRRLTTRLLEAGHTSLAQQAYVEAERLTTMGTLSLEGRKRLKYGTRSLLSAVSAFKG